MDCVIPGYAVRSFCASIGCLSKIGKDLYVEFDPIDGMALRSLNDAKSAYACFRFEPSFFERCTAPPPSTFAATTATTTTTTVMNTTTTATSRKRQHSTLSNTPQPHQPQQEAFEQRFSCRIALRALAPVIRPRKGVVSLRIRKYDLTTAEHVSAALLISFEFHLQKSADAPLLHVIHRIQAAEATSVSAVASSARASEIVAAPRALSRLLEPLKRTVEAALIIRKAEEMVSAASFHHSDTTAPANSSNSNSSNALLQSTSAALFKTETGISCDEFDEFFFRDDRGKKHHDDNIEDDDHDDDDDVDDASLPDTVNEEVILVFPIKEAKAMLQFCAQPYLEQELRVTLFFHWGGRPIIFETSAESFSAELVLATLDYKLLSSLHKQQAAAVAAAAAASNHPGEDENQDN